MLGIAVPKNQLHCTIQVDPGTTSQAALMGVHWKMVLTKLESSHLVFNVPTVYSAMVNHLFVRLKIRL